MVKVSIDFRVYQFTRKRGVLAWTAYSRLNLEARTVHLLRVKRAAEVPYSKEEILRNSLANISEEEAATQTHIFMVIITYHYYGPFHPTVLS